MDGENTKLKQYLLGALPDGENEAFDLRIISDESFANEMALAEHELSEDYLEAMLSREEIALFHSNFLVSAERRAMLREIILLKEFAKKKADPEQQATQLAKPAKNTGRFSFYFRPLLVGAAILIGVLALGLLWNIYFRDARSPLEREYAELNKRDLNDLAQLTNYYPINLSSATFRDTVSIPKQSADKFTGTVLFRLALAPKTGEGSEFSVKVRCEGTKDFAIDNVRAYRNPNGHEIRVLVPGSVLQKGPCQIVVEPKGVAAAAATYVFAVE
ncbi:MAG: hypothetical protein ABIU09_10135 [Pyrinomonadaceae bacterium]